MAPRKAIDGRRSTKNDGKSDNRTRTHGAKSKISKQPNIRRSVQQKTKPKSIPVKKRRKVYTDKELGIPKLNMITPVGVDLPKGKKKGKVFVDDQESMMAILAVVNASKDGQIESKIMKARHLEEIRQARLKEAETRQEQKNSKLEETKDSLRRKRKRKLDIGPDDITAKLPNKDGITKADRKQVSFA